MTVTDESRHKLHTHLDHVLGPEDAVTLMEHLPPVGWADVATNESVRTEIHHVHQRFDLQDRRIDELVAQQDLRWEARFAEQDARLEARFLEQDARLEARFLEQDARLEARLLEQDVRWEQRFAHVDARFAQVDARFAQVDERFAQVDARFTDLEHAMALQEQRIMSALHEAISDLKSTCLWMLIGSQVSMAGLVVAAAKLL